MMEDGGDELWGDEMSGKREKRGASKAKKARAVKVVNDSLDVTVVDTPCVVEVFAAAEAAPGDTVTGPPGGLDLTGYTEYRLTLHLAGDAGTPFVLEEVHGPVGTLDEFCFEVGRGSIGPDGILNYRGRFTLFGPRRLFIRIGNHGDHPLLIDGMLYAVR